MRSSATARVLRSALSESAYFRVLCFSACWSMLGGIFDDVDVPETCLLFSLSSYRSQTEVYYEPSELQPVSVSDSSRHNGAFIIAESNLLLVQITPSWRVLIFSNFKVLGEYYLSLDITSTVNNIYNTLATFLKMDSNNLKCLFYTLTHRKFGSYLIKAHK